MELRTFLTELRRRNVYDVAIAYGVVAWLLMQVASQIFPFFEIPNWAVRLVVLLPIICCCCESEPGILTDPHCGPVCSDCYAMITATPVTLEKIGPLVGIGACSNEVNCLSRPTDAREACTRPPYVHGKIWRSRSNFSYRPICMPLEAADQLHLRVATGYIELGMFEEANAELEEIDPFCRHLPEALVARLAIFHGLEKWEPLAVVAKKLTEWNPNEPGFFVELAYVTRRGESIHEAHAILTHAAGLHPNDPTIPKRKAIDYACGRFGGGRGEVHVFGDDDATIERSIVIDDRGQYPQVG